MKPTLCLSLLAVIASALTFCSLSSSPVVSTPPVPTPELLLGDAPTQSGKLRVMRVAHSSVLLDFAGSYVLTDPWFSEKTSFHPGEPLGLALAQLPKLSAVVASHAHYDHFDIETFAAYPHKDVPFYVGPDMVGAAREAGFTNVHELAPGQQATVGPLTITAAPGAHGVPETTWLLDAAGYRVYFAADTLLSPEVRKFAEEAGAVDLLLPAVNGLHAMGKQVVMSADEAALLARMLPARVAVPTHYAFKGSWFTETFILSRDGTPEAFVDAVKKESPSTLTRILPPGQWLTLSK